MHDFNRQQPIHPADCNCLRCEPRPLGLRRLHPEHALIGLIVTASFVGAALAVFGTTN
jgi:hypothetical protein